MPRILYPRRHKLTPEQIRDRAKRYRVTRSNIWIDPYPDIPGTKPEKMVFAALRQRQIQFYFQKYEYFNVPNLESSTWFRPDFIVPSLNLVIEVQGNYWHTLPEKIQSDAIRFAVMQMAGWKVLTWWEYDIESRLDDLINSEPLLAQAARGTPLPPAPKYYDDLKAIKKKNRERRKPWTHKPATLKIKRVPKPKYRKVQSLTG